eukprot:14258803-Alexandrium_andersonii.AAC.1
MRHLRGVYRIVRHGRERRKPQEVPALTAVAPALKVPGTVPGNIWSDSTALGRSRVGTARELG